MTAIGQTSGEVHPKSTLTFLRLWQAYIIYAFSTIGLILISNSPITTIRSLVGNPLLILSIFIIFLTPKMTLAVDFVDVTEEVGINFRHSNGARTSMLPEDMGSGAGFADIDNDGDLDLYIVNIPGLYLSDPSSLTPKSKNVLYQNDGNGGFVDITNSAGVGDTGYGMGCVFADYNGDGFVDLYVTNLGNNVLYKNNGNNTFMNVTKIASVECPLWSTGACFTDIDNDNDLDLYVCNYVDFDLVKFEDKKEESLQSGKFVPNALNPTVFDPQENVLYRNNGDGTFTDITSMSGVAAPGGRSMQAIFSDFDEDNDVDLYVANDTSDNHVYRNEGNGTFTDVSADSWAADFRGSMGLAAGDYDSDEDIDVFISHWIDQEYVIYRNLLKEEKTSLNSSSQGIRFVDESYSAMLAEITLKEIGWGTSLFDYDNDGDLDIFVANGSTFQRLDQPEVLIPQQNQLFHNEGDSTFTDVSKNSGISIMPIQVSRGTTFGDYDNDGDIDIFIVNNYSKSRLLRNNTIESNNRNNWLQVKLVGTDMNRNAIGAKILLRTTNANQIREIYAGESYMSSNSYIAHFGLGKSTKVNSIQITWTNGKKQSIQDIEINQRIEITQEP